MRERRIRRAVPLKDTALAEGRDGFHVFTPASVAISIISNSARLISQRSVTIPTRGKLRVSTSNTVRFTDQTSFCVRYACDVFAVGAKLSDWQSGDFHIIREYMKPIPR
jgi:hypothetical protein